MGIFAHFPCTCYPLAAPLHGGNVAEKPIKDQNTKPELIDREEAEQQSSLGIYLKKFAKLPEVVFEMT